MRQPSSQVLLCCALSVFVPAEGHGGSHHHAKKAGTAGAVAVGRGRFNRGRALSQAGWSSTENGPFRPFVNPWPNFKKYMDIDHSHNWCPIKEAILAGTVQFKDALRGQNVSFLMAIQDNPVSVVYNETSKQIMGGLPADVFEEVAKRAGFNWKQTSTVADYIDRTKNETDDAWLLWAVKHFDVVDWFTITPARSRKGLKFAYPFINISPHLVGKLQPVTDTIWDRFLACFSPFSWMLWLMIAGGFLFSAAIYVCIESGRDDIPQKSATGGLGQAFFLTVCQFTGGGGYAPATPAGKLFVMSASFLVMLLVTAYTANLASELILEKVSEMPIHSVEDAITRDLPVCVRSGSPFFRMMSRHYPDIPLVQVPRERDKYPAVLKGECIAAITGQTWWDFESRMSGFNPDCNLYSIGRNLMEMHGSFVAQATSATCKEVVIDVLTFTMHQMYLDGFLEEAKDYYIDEFQDVFCPPRHAMTSSSKMEPRHMFGVFLVHAMISFICIAISVWSGNCALPGSSYSSFESRESDEEEMKAMGGCAASIASSD